MEITTGLPDITKVKYNGYQLTADDVAEFAAVGSSAGDIVMWLAYRAANLTLGAEEDNTRRANF